MTDEWGKSAEDHEIEQDLHLRHLHLRVQSDEVLAQCIHERRVLVAIIFGQTLVALVLAIVLFVVIHAG